MSLNINDKYWFSFCKAHPGVVDCLANRAVLEDFAQSSGLLLDGFGPDTYSFCANQIPDRLALNKPKVVVQRSADELRVAENKRLRNLSVDDLHKEIRTRQTYVEPVVNLPYTALQIKQMPARALRDLISYSNGQERPGYRREVDRILREAAVGE